MGARVCAGGPDFAELRNTGSRIARKCRTGFGIHGTQRRY